MTDFNLVYVGDCNNMFSQYNRKNPFSVTTDSLRCVLQTSVMRLPHAVAPLKSDLQSQWLIKLLITLFWLYGKLPFLHSKITALHCVLWDPLLLDFPILATCSQVVTKELNHWANQPTLFSRTTLKGWFMTKIVLDDNPKCLYEGEKCMRSVFNNRPLHRGFLQWRCRKCFHLLQKNKFLQLLLTTILNQVILGLLAIPTPKPPSGPGILDSEKRLLNSGPC